MASNLWCNQVGTLALPQYHDLPKGSHRGFPKFSGQNDQDPNEHILAMKAMSAVLGI